MGNDPIYGAIVMAVLAVVLSGFLFYPVFTDLRALVVKRRLRKQIAREHQQWIARQRNRQLREALR